MAGDWIKVEENMPDKPEVYGMAAQLGIEVDAVVGKLIRVWSWASRNCPVSGRTDVRSLSAIDRVAFMPGFANAMASAGWLVTEGDVVAFPNFDRHCSQTAKERALDQKRKRDSREKTSGSCPDTNRTKTGLEKRREEKSIIPPVCPPAGDSAVKAPELTDAQWLESLAVDPTYQGIDVQTEHGKMCRWCDQNRKQPSRRRFINWLNRCEKPMTGTTQSDQPQRRMSFA